MSGSPTARPVEPGNCDRYAWHGDAEFLPHLWDVLQMDGRRGRTVLHEPVLSWSVQSRKVLGRELREQIGAAIGAGICRGAGRRAEPTLPGRAQRTAADPALEKKKGGVNLLFRSDLRVWAFASLSTPS